MIGATSHRTPYLLVLMGSVVLNLCCVDAGTLWPTPNPAFQLGQPLEAFIQPTASGRVESGLFGCVRNNGQRFHEALDLLPVSHDERGEAADPIFAVLPGRVVYMNTTAGYSSYGRYIVVEHDSEVPAFFTLYAHLSKIAVDLSVGDRVQAGSVLGIMGRSASYTIPQSQAHLHFEIGVRLTDQFQAWYDRQKFKTPNRHGIWNGMNLVGIDPLAFYTAIRKGSVQGFGDYLNAVPAAARIRVYTNQVPDFVKNYPSLVTRSYAGRKVVAWDVAFTAYGLPKEWTPRFDSDGLSGKAGDVGILTYNPQLLTSQRCHAVLQKVQGSPAMTSGTLSTLRLLFGFK